MATVTSDDDPKKWEMKLHTKVKHRILSKYLVGWIRKLSKYGKICYFDCFAGRGRYESEEIGSPLIAMNMAAGNNKYFSEFICTFIEKNKDNFLNLKNEINNELKNNPTKYDKVKILEPINDEFSNVAKKLLKSVDKIAPSFFFIDPFGFKGLPFDVIKDLLSKYQHTEVFITLMSRDVSRFYTDEFKEATITELFGTDEWKKFKDIEGIEKEIGTINLYINQLRRVAKYVRIYRLSMDECRKTGYYLVHATNVFDGFKLMTDVMFNESTNKGMFAYLGPEDGQKTLASFLSDEKKVKEFLISSFSKKTLSYNDIIFHCYTTIDNWTEPKYREILKKMETDKLIQVERITSKTLRGLSGRDIIKFL